MGGWSGKRLPLLKLLVTQSRGLRAFVCRNKQVASQFKSCCIIYARIMAAVMNCVQLFLKTQWIAHSKFENVAFWSLHSDLAKVFTPQKIQEASRATASKYCFYYEDLRVGSKDSEVGDCFGTVQDDALKKWRVEFHDGVEEQMGPRQMAMSLQVCVLDAWRRGRRYFYDARTKLPTMQRQWHKFVFQNINF